MSIQHTVLVATLSAAVTKLREVPLYVSPEYAGIPPKAEYHPDSEWLQEHGRDPAMARAGRGPSSGPMR